MRFEPGSSHTAVRHVTALTTADCCITMYTSICIARFTAKRLKSAQTMPAFTPQPQNIITALWLVLILNCLLLLDVTVILEDEM